jgi:hypothetical protein
LIQECEVERSPAVSYCYDCDRDLCGLHRKLHRYVRSWRHHKMVPVTVCVDLDLFQYPSSMLTLPFYVSRQAKHLERPAFERAQSRLIVELEASGQDEVDADELVASVVLKDQLQEPSSSDEVDEKHNSALLVCPTLIFVCSSMHTRS